MGSPRHSPVFESGYTERGKKRGSRGRGNDLHHVTQITAKSQGRSSSEAGLGAKCRQCCCRARHVPSPGHTACGDESPSTARPSRLTGKTTGPQNADLCVICLGKPGQPSGAVFLFPLAHFSPFHKAEFRQTSAANMYQQTVNTASYQTCNILLC